jgi:thiol-disulfide isomerase/thioredoxin
MHSTRREKPKFTGRRAILIWASISLLIGGWACSTKNLLNDSNEKFGSIWVSSNPPGGEILLDHVVTGRVTPDTLKEVPVGVHVISVIKEGFITTPDSVLISVIANGFASVRFDLYNSTDKFGSIWVNSNPPGGEILLDHVVTGLVTPDTLKEVPVGEHVISVTKEGFITVPDSVSISVTDNGFDSVSFDLLEPTKGTLKVISDPAGATICIDQQPQTELTPYVFFNSIPVGAHTISVFKEGYANDEPAKESVNVVTQDTAEVDFVLSPAEVGKTVGNITPDFELEDDYHVWYRFYAYRGWVTMINFWATDCTNCMKELPYLQQIYTDYLADSLILFGINYGGGQGTEGFETISQVREQRHITFILLKGGGTSVKSDYGVTLTPVTIILDRSGRIYYYMEGFTAGWEGNLKQKLDELFGS